MFRFTGHDKVAFRMYIDNCTNFIFVFEILAQSILESLEEQSIQNLPGHPSTSILV